MWLKVVDRFEGLERESNDKQIAMILLLVNRNRSGQRRGRPRLVKVFRVIQVQGVTAQGTQGLPACRPRH
jgi:hypothetical protein